MWLKMFTDIVGDGAIIAIAANKSDLIDAIQVDPEESKKWCQENGFIFGQTSAQNGEGVQELFTDLSVKLLDVLIQKRKLAEASLIPAEPKGCSC